MKRILPVLLLLGLFFFPATARAESGREVTEELLESTGAGELFELLPDEAASLLEQNGIYGVDSQMLLDLNGGDFLSLLFDGIKAGLRQPVTILAAAVGVILLAALCETFEDGFADKKFGQTFRVVSVLALSSILVVPVMKLMESVVELTEKIGNFLLGFVPVYAGLISVSGKPLSAFAYNGIMVGAVEGISLVAANLLLPLCSIYLALCLTGAVSDEVSAAGIAGSLKSFLNWTLGLLLTLFVGLLTIKSFVAGAADGVAMKTGKYLIGSFLPVIGGALSDTLSVVQGSLGVIRSTAGAFGILAVTVCVLPVVLEILFLMLAMKAAGAVGDILGVKKVSGLLESTGFVLSFLQSILIFYGMMAVISILLMLVTGVGS